MMADDAFSRHRALISPSLSAPSFPTFPTSPSPSSDRRSSAPLHRPAAPGTSGSRASSGPPTFAYNLRVAVALVPSAFFLLSLGGIAVFAILAAGLAAAYFLDSFRHSRAAFFAVWSSLVATSLAFFFSATLPSLTTGAAALAAVGLLLVSETTFLIGVWASLQFLWLRLENPAVVTALERLLFACIPVAAPSIITWAAIASVGMAHAAYYHLAFAAVFYWLFSLPRPTSFSAGSDILGPLESCIHALYLLFAPLLVHIATHHTTLFTSAAAIADLVLLFFVPFLFQLYASTRGALWWVTKNPNQLHQLRVVNGAVALLAVVLALEIRVVFHSFARYLHAPPPLNYLLVTVTMLGGSSAIGAYAVGMINDDVSSVAFTALAVIVSGAGALVIGFPIMFIPLPLVSGYCIATFFTRKRLSSYFAFVGLASLMVLWFVVHNYWDLSIWVVGMPLKSFTKYIVAALIMAMAIPGLALLPSKLHFLTGVGLVCHALLICYIEDRLFNYTNMYYSGFEEDVMYPGYFVLLTTFLGFAVVKRMSVDQRIGTAFIWILTCLYLAKLSILFISSKTVLWVSAILLLVVSPPVFFYRDKSKGSSRMKVWQGYIHAFTVAFAAWLCRETLFEALQWWQGKPPSDGLFLGSYILLTGLACVPIVALHFSAAQSAKRILVLVISTGLLLFVIQPPISLSWAFQSELIKAAHQSNDDVSIYGFVAPKPTWPSWLLIATVVLTIAATTSIIPVKYIAELRALYAVTVGVTVGIYVCVEYFFQAIILYPFIVSTIVCASVFVVFTHLPSASSTRILPWIFALLVALLPLTYLLEGQLQAKNVPEEAAASFTTALAIEGARMSLLGLYAALFMLIALVIKFDLAALLREKVAESHGSRSSVLPPKTKLHQRRPHAVPAFTIKRLAAEAAWMPAIGNVSTVLCFLVCLVLNITLSGGSNRAIFILAPILLLLNQDSDIIVGFGDRQRYFPVTLAITVYLVLNTLYRIWEETWPGDGSWGLSIGGPGWLFVVKNVALLILTLPNHILFNRFMWDYVKQTDSVLLLTMPLNLPPVIITDILAVRVLGLLGIIYSLAQYLISRRIRLAGLKYI